MASQATSALDNSTDPQCAECGEEFHFLAVELCHKCEKMKGVSETEQKEIKKQPQCRSCGKVFSRMPHSLLCAPCLRCWNNPINLPAPPYLLQFDKFPRPSGTSEQAQPPPSNSTAGRVLKSAAAFQSKAQQPRFAQAIIHERKLKKELHKTAIKLTGYLWEHNSDANKLTVISGCTHSLVFEPGRLVRGALLEVFGPIAKIYSQLPQNHGDLLTIDDVDIHAHESGTVHSSIDQGDLDGTMQTLFELFEANHWGTKANLEGRKIAVRYVYRKPLDDLDDESFDSFLIGKSGTKRKSTASVRTSEFRASKARSIDGHRLGIGPARQSAFRPPKSFLTASFSREPPLTEHLFTRTTACLINTSEGTTVRFEAAETFEVISLPLDWERGKELAVGGRSHYHTGWIGEGYTKMAIYARVDGEEYAITLPTDTCMSALSVEAILKEELKLLCQCHDFKCAFDTWICQPKLKTVPSFYFNFDGAFIGRLERSKSSKSLPLPFEYFLATRLLPCGSDSKGVVKFTGNDNVGAKPSNDLEMVIHAFAHFSYVYSQKYLVMCDLQGILDKKGIMCLIDPQCHTQSKSALDDIYWNGGRSKIDLFLKQHMPHCRTNWICQALKLEKTRIETIEENTKEPRFELEDSDEEERENGAPTTPPRRNSGPLRHGFTPGTVN